MRTSLKESNDGAYRADAVVTFTAPKMAHVFGNLTSRTGDGGFGPVVVTEIGSPEEAVKGASGMRWTGSAKAVGGEASGGELE